MGQVARFHTTLPKENPNQLVSEMIKVEEVPTTVIKALNSEHFFLGINKVKFNDIEASEPKTADIEQKNLIGLTKGVKVLKANINLIIEDRKARTGTIFCELTRNFMKAVRSLTEEKNKRLPT